MGSSHVPSKAKRGLLMDLVHGQKLFSFTPLSAQMCPEVGDNHPAVLGRQIMSTALSDWVQVTLQPAQVCQWWN